MARERHGAERNPSRRRCDQCQASDSDWLIARTGERGELRSPVFMCTGCLVKWVLSATLGELRVVAAEYAAKQGSAGTVAPTRIPGNGPRASGG